LPKFAIIYNLELKTMTATQFTIRPPIVVVLGHIDHGKSSILEAIKDLKITTKEAGGITQHIGAYEVEHQGKKITFIDTPGHEAFWAIRSRGAKVADLAILVVAADEGVKPQTIEAIECAKKAGIPVIVAINKIDKPGADPKKVKNELVKNGIVIEEFGGKIPVVETSAITKQGIDELLEMILLTAEMGEIKTEINKPAAGVVIEAYLDPKRGPTATLLIKEGILSLQDIIATPSSTGRVKILEDFQGKQINKAYPSQPVVVIGLERVPQVGEKFKVFSDIESARQYAIKKEREEREVIFIGPGKKALNLIIKADVLGSLEAVETIIKSLPQLDVVPRILKKEVGDVNEDDVKLAVSGLAKILGFRVKINPQAQKLAKQKGIEILTFEIIYDLVQKIRELIKKMVESEIVRRDLGKLKVLVVFRSEKNRQIVGGRIIEGEIIKGAKLEILREERKIGSGEIINLQREKKDIESGKVGDEVGILYEGNAKIKEGDVLVAYIEERKKFED
jgi:translation initiation factor IF-2